MVAKAQLLLDKYEVHGYHRLTFTFVTFKFRPRSGENSVSIDFVFDEIW